MKKLMILAFAGALLSAGISSCKKTNSSNNNNNNGNGSGDVIEVPIDRSDTTTLPSAIAPLTVMLDFMNPGGVPGGPMQIDTFATKVDEYITPYGFAKKDITKVNVTKLRINIENAAGQYFNFVKDTTPVSIKVFVDSVGGTNPKMVAFRTDIPQNVQELELTVDPVDIKDFFNAQYMRILIGFYTQQGQGLVGTAKFRVNYSFKVTAIMP